MSKVNYAAFASFLGAYPDCLALKRFRELQIRNLLFYQAELAHLEEDLEKLEQDDAKDTTATSELTNHRWTPSMAQEAPSLSNTPAANQPMSSRYSEKMRQIRRTLENYNSAVEQYKRLNDISCPKPADMKAVSDWLNSMHRGAYFLLGDVEDVWDITSIDGQTSPAGTKDFYGFEDTSGIAVRLGLFFASLQNFFTVGRKKNAARHVDTTSSGALGQTVSTVIASVLPIIPIVVFYFVKGLLVRIGLILAFTALFAGILVLGLSLKADTTLGITTAIAAIQVVYVGTTSNSTSA